MDVDEDHIRSEYEDSKEALEEVQEDLRRLRMEERTIGNRIEHKRQQRSRLKQADAEDLIGVADDAPDQEVDETRRFQLEEIRQDLYELEERKEEIEEEISDLGDEEEDLVFQCNQAENLADREGFDLPGYDGDEEDE